MVTKNMNCKVYGYTSMVLLQGRLLKHFYKGDNLSRIVFAFMLLEFLMGTTLKGENLLSVESKFSPSSAVPI